MQNDNTTTAARDLARELREELDRLAPSRASHIHLAINATRINTIAATLDALADENERLREAVARYLDTGFVSARNELSVAIGREGEQPSEPGSFRNAVGVVSELRR